MSRNESLKSGRFLSALIALLQGGSLPFSLCWNSKLQSLAVPWKHHLHYLYIVSRWQCHYVSLYEREIIFKSTECGGLGNSSANSLEGAVSLLVSRATQTQVNPVPKPSTLAVKCGLGNPETWRTWMLLSSDKDTESMNLGSKPCYLSYIYSANNLSTNCIN